MTMRFNSNASRRLFRCFVLLLGALSASWRAHSQEKPGAAASSNVDGAEYPRVLDDLRVEFLVHAPAAQKVQVHLGGTFDLAKQPDGTWTGTSSPQVPGFHYYSLVIDGVEVNDPNSKTYFGINRESSAIEIPERGVDFYDIKDVPHGDVRERWYFSKVAHSWRRCLIYTPPGYDRSVNERYPVLYLQHGAGEDETGWVRQGRANFILDNLIAAGKAVPMLIVMDKGYATRDGSPIAPIFGPSAPALGTPASLQRMREMSAAFADVVVSVLIPFIDSSYRTIADREHRAIAGLSMGAMQSFDIGFSHPDKFAYVAGFSGAPTAFLFGNEPIDRATFYGGILADADTANQRFRLLWLGVGTAEDARFLKGIRSFHECSRMPAYIRFITSHPELHMNGKRGVGIFTRWRLCYSLRDHTDFAPDYSASAFLQA
jgi:enterochelin esterase-like enzyme